MFSVKPLTNDLFPRWDAYVKSNPEGSPFHLTNWKTAVEGAFGHRTFYYYAESDSEIVGVLPLIQLKSILFGNIISSVPFAAYGGPLANDERVFQRLLDHAKQVAKDRRADYLDLKFQHVKETGLHESELHVTFIKELSADHDINMKAIPRKQRAMVRKGIKSELTCHISGEYLDDFFDIYAANVQRMGTPVYSRKWFGALLNSFRDDAELMVVKHEDDVISGVLSIYYKDTVLPYYAASRVEYRNLAPNDFQYWELMRHAVERGCRFFDFGRSKKGSGHYSFKKHWGFEPQQLHYQYYLNRLTELPEINPMNPKYKIKIAMWKRLPASIAKLLGPIIVKNIP